MNTYRDKCYVSWQQYVSWQKYFRCFAIFLVKLLPNVHSIYQEIYNKYYKKYVFLVNDNFKLNGNCIYIFLYSKRMFQRYLAKMVEYKKYYFIFIDIFFKYKIYNLANWTSIFWHNEIIFLRQTLCRRFILYFYFLPSRSFDCAACAYILKPDAYLSVP